jgi:hypothetical protein
MFDPKQTRRALPAGLMNAAPWQRIGAGELISAGSVATLASG